MKRCLAFFLVICLCLPLNCMFVAAEKEIGSSYEGAAPALYLGSKEFGGFSENSSMTLPIETWIFLKADLSLLDGAKVPEEWNFYVDTDALNQAAEYGLLEYDYMQSDDSNNLALFFPLSLDDFDLTFGLCKNDGTPLAEQTISITASEDACVMQAVDKDGNDVPYVLLVAGGDPVELSFDCRIEDPSEYNLFPGCGFYSPGLVEDGFDVYDYFANDIFDQMALRVSAPHDMPARVYHLTYSIVPTNVTEIGWEKVSNVFQRELDIIVVSPYYGTGDVNGDTEINLKDVLALRKSIAGIGETLTSVNADVNADGEVNLKDVLQLRKSIAGIVEKNEPAKEITAKEWLENEGAIGSCKMNLELVSLLNPVYAVVKDDTAEFNLFGLYVNGQMMDFDSLGMTEGTKFSIVCGAYNVFYETPEMQYALLDAIKK